MLDSAKYIAGRFQHTDAITFSLLLPVSDFALILAVRLLHYYPEGFVDSLTSCSYLAETNTVRHVLSGSVVFYRS